MFLRVATTLLATALTSGQFDADPTDTVSQRTRRELDGISVAAQNSNYCYERARFLSNRIGSRLSGSPQAAMAVSYVQKQLIELGLDVRLEAVTVPHWVRGEETAELVRYPGQLKHTSHKIVVTALGNTVATPPGGISAPVLVVQTFEELESLPDDSVRGKILLFNYRFDESAAENGHWEQAYRNAAQYRNTGPSLAAQKGAIAALVRSIGPRRSHSPHTGITRFNDEVARIPAGAVTGQDADRISELAKRGEVEIRLTLLPSEFQDAQSHNVIGDLRGSQFPEQIVVVSAHLDSWDLGTGALDDAAGVGVAMDVLRLIKATNPHPMRTIRFVAWMNEENGGAGGRAYAAEHKLELDDHIAAIEIDYGDGRPVGLNVAGNNQRVASLSKILHSIADPIGGMTIGSDSPGADLTELSRSGVPVIAPVQEARHYFDYHHSATDTFDKVRIQELKRCVDVIARLAYALAQS